MTYKYTVGNTTYITDIEPIGVEFTIVELPTHIETKTLIELIRERYSINDEFAIQRQRLEKPNEFQEYFDYVELCKISLK